MSNLTDLGLDRNNISNLQPLKGLSNLTDLGLGRNNISNLQPLKELSNLNFLSLEHKNISNVTPLKNLTNLTILVLTSNPISNITPLQFLTNLEELQMGTCSVSSIPKNFGYLTKLWYFTLVGNPITTEFKNSVIQMAKLRAKNNSVFLELEIRETDLAHILRAPSEENSDFLSDLYSKGISLGISTGGN